MREATHVTSPLDKPTLRNGSLQATDGPSGRAGLLLLLLEGAHRLGHIPQLLGDFLLSAAPTAIA